MNKKIVKYFEDHNLTVVEEPKLSLYGFTMFKEVEGVPVAYLKIGERTIFVRTLNQIHFKHLNRLDKLRSVIREQRHDVKKEVNERRADWFRKVHTEVYKRI